jgi:hypothetical protein
MSKHITVTFGFPDTEVMAELGRLVIMQGHLEYVLKMTFKSLQDISIVEALQRTNKATGKALREKVEKLAREKLIEGEALEQLLNLIERAWKAAEIRNQFVHNVWARVNFDQLHLQNNNHSWRKAPTKNEIENLTTEISNIVCVLNESRLSGIIAEKLNAK